MTRTGSSRRATRSSTGSPPKSARSPARAWKGRAPVTEQERGGSERPDSSEPHGQEETGGQSRDPLLPSDEDAAWAAIVAGYGEEPPDPPGAKPFKSVEDLALLEPETNDAPEPSGTDRSAAKKDEPDEDQGKQRPLGSSVSFAPGIAATPGPRDHTAPEPSDDDFDAADEGHFVPPEPPPLPEGDVTARFAWIAVVGGPILLLLAVLLGWDMTWWLATLCIGGFLGGFGTLVARMSPGDDEDGDDPGRGAVV
ncbi:hypothetical protein ACOKM3_29490 [Streptomyces sp. BH106]|uniref:hypothetical protein n=1 Tax=Streptomyces sp. BH106 TaxID=3410409 RepID=UPI003CF176BC